MRGSQHAKSIYEFTIDSDGMHIGKPFTNVHNIILGMPSIHAEGDGRGFEKIIEEWHEDHEWLDEEHKR